MVRMLVVICCNYSACNWLVSGAKPGDSLFFQFSGIETLRIHTLVGHGGQTVDKNGDEDDGLDET